jgi:hypothetical protein
MKVDPDRPCWGFVRVVIVVACILMLWRIAVVDKQLGLSSNISARYQYHAIPVALSQLYHGRQHDYTAFKDLALKFQAADANLDELISHYADPATPVGEQTYFWAADDRGLSDYVFLAFLLFGPSSHSLGALYLLLLGLSLLCFLVGFWHSQQYLLLAMVTLACFLGFAHLCPYHQQIAGGITAPVGGLALHESRMFEALAILGLVHLGLLIWQIEPASRLTWVTALPQVALLLFLYHARSSLGWVYLALFVVAGCRLVPLAWRAVRRGPLLHPGVVRPLLVVFLLVGSLLGLSQYTRLVYHPAYFAEQGSRTFWHNAIMGFSYHPQLATRLNLGVDDRLVIRHVIGRMRATNDPRLDASWTEDNILCSLGSVTQFDWLTYETVAREAYFAIWREHPGKAFASYFWYKPQVVLQQIIRAGNRLIREVAKRPLLLLTLLGTVVVLGAYTWGNARNRSLQVTVRWAGLLGLLLLPFSLIPAVAFYIALTTMSGFYLLLLLNLALQALNGMIALRRWWAGDSAAPTILPFSATPKRRDVETAAAA